MTKLLIFFSLIPSIHRYRERSVGIVLSLAIGMMFAAPPVSGQITRDTTLGSSSSQVVSNSTRDRIQGGASRGTNLFHSFTDFNVAEGRQVYFANPNGIANIFSRVTGSRSSNILGTLGVEGPANLFLLNPNGILFGPSARLDLQGAFSASTADRWTFEDGAFFSATQPQNSLLTVSIPAGLQVGNGASSATHRVNLSAPSVEFIGEDVTLVDGNLIGGAAPSSGEISLFKTGLENLSGDAPLFIAATNNIVLQDLANNALDLQSGSGEVRFAADSDGSGAGAFIMEDVADTIRTFGRDLILSGASLQLGQLNTSANPDQDAGQLLSSARSVSDPSGPALTTISGQLSTATDVDLYQIYISGTEPFSASTVVSEASDAIANPPNTQLFLFDAQGRGVYGNDNDLACNCLQSTLSPTKILPAGTYYLGVASYATNPISAQGAIFPNSFETLDFNALNLPTGSGGRAALRNWNSQPGIEVGGYDITLAGVKGVARQVVEMPVANGGDITLSTTHGGIRSGALTTAATRRGGDITLTAEDGGLDLTGTLNTLGLQGNGGRVSLNATGDIRFRTGTSVLTRGQLGGDLAIQSDRDIVVQGGLLSQQSTTTDLNPGKGGGFKIQGRSLLLQDGAQLVSSTLGTASLKNSNIDVQDQVVLTGFGEVNLFSPFGLLATQVGTNATGDGGDLTMTAGNLRVNDAAVVATRSFGLGNAGDLTITGDEILVTGAVEVDDSFLLAGGESLFESELSTEAEAESDELLFQGGIPNTTPFLLSEANAGDLRLNVGRLRVENGGEISAGTHSRGDGGNFTIVADEVIVTGQMLGENSELGTETVPEFLGARPPEGSAGNLSITSDRLIVTDGGQIKAETLALGGNAGQIDINAREIEVGGGFFNDGEIKNSSISSEVLNGAEEELQGDTTRDFGGRGGTLNIEAETITLRDGGRLTASSDGNGDAGDVNISAETIDIMGAFTPTIDLDTMTPLNNAPPVPSGVFAASGVDGQSAGNIQITAQNRLRLSNLATIEASTLGGQGNIVITGDTVLMANGSQITTNAGGRSTGGNITLDLNLLIATPFFGNNDITANAEDGSGGQIRISTRLPIFGFQVGEGGRFRSENLTPADIATNDITAFSQFNPTIDVGGVTIDPPELDPTQDIEPPVLVDASDRIATGCPAQQGNRFAVTGQGGLPSDPRRGQRGLAIAHDFRLHPNSGPGAQSLRADTRTQANPTHRPETESIPSIVEAQAFGRAPDGTPMLTATNTHPYSPTLIATACKR